MLARYEASDTGLVGTLQARVLRDDSGLTTTPPATLGSISVSDRTWWLGIS